MGAEVAHPRSRHKRRCCWVQGLLDRGFPAVLCCSIPFHFARLFLCLGQLLEVAFPILFTTFSSPPVCDRLHFLKQSGPAVPTNPPRGGSEGGIRCDLDEETCRHASAFFERLRRFNDLDFDEVDHCNFIQELLLAPKSRVWV